MKGRTMEEKQPPKAPESLSFCIETGFEIGPDEEILDQRSPRQIKRARLKYTARKKKKLFRA